MRVNVDGSADGGAVVGVNVGFACARNSTGVSVPVWGQYDRGCGFQCGRVGIDGEVKGRYI